MQKLREARRAAVVNPPAELAPEMPARGQRSSEESPDEQAAKVTDFEAVMMEGLERVQNGQAYNYPFYNAVIRRWMREDPEACLGWIGRLEMKTGWSDPFNALFSGEVAIDPGRVLELMDDSWLPRNRQRVFGALASWVGRERVEQLTEVLDRLPSESERQQFLKGALQGAQAADLERWVAVIEEVAGGQRDAHFQSLAAALMGSRSQQWQVQGGEVVPSPSSLNREAAEQADEAMRAVRGTPAEAIFEAHHQRLALSSELSRFRAMAALDPTAALEGSIRVRIESGDDPEAARREAIQSLRSELDEWGVRELERGLQGVLLGTQPMRGVLGDQFAAIEASLPEEFQDGARGRTLTAALTVEPAQTIAVALERGLEDELADAIGSAMSSSGVSREVRAEMLQEVMAGPAWEKIEDGEQRVGGFAVGYLVEDREGALAWLQSLSQRDRLESILESARLRLIERKREDLVDLLEQEIREVR